MVRKSISCLALAFVALANATIWLSESVRGNTPDEVEMATCTTNIESVTTAVAVELQRWNPAA